LIPENLFTKTILSAFVVTVIDCWRLHDKIITQQKKQQSLMQRIERKLFFDITESVSKNL
jgi:hypothetical protein